MKSGLVLILALALPSLSYADKNQTDDPKILHAIGAMIQLKLKPENVTKVLSGTWQRTTEPLSCIYFTKGKAKKTAIAAVGQVKLVPVDGREQETLCYPAKDMTASVKYFAPSYLD